MAKFEKVKLEKDKLIAKLDETNKLNENLNFQFSSHVDKIKSLEEQLVESKTKVEKLTSAKLVVEPNYYPSVARVDSSLIESTCLFPETFKQNA